VTICREGTCDWYAERAVLVRGADEQTTTRLFKLKMTSTGALLAALSTLEQIGQVYLVGHLRAHVPASPPTVTVAGDNLRVVTLTYARPKDLRAWPATAVFDVDLIVQVRHSPGAIVPDVMLASATQEMPFLLRRHLP
jgi:hypothetical protein